LLFNYNVVSNIEEVKIMENITFTNGTNIYDFFITPTIRYNNDGFCKYLTIEWLRWFIGVKWW
jgi:hypothetical protein